MTWKWAKRWHAESSIERSDSPAFVTGWPCHVINHSSLQRLFMTSHTALVVVSISVCGWRLQLSWWKLSLLSSSLCTEIVVVIITTRYCVHSSSSTTSTILSVVASRKGGRLRQRHHLYKLVVVFIVVVVALTSPSSSPHPSKPSRSGCVSTWLVHY